MSWLPEGYRKVLVRLMPLTDQDARALTYLARRLRDETHGCATWDEPGTYAAISRLVGQNLHLSIERVARHAADREAKTPGAIGRPFVPGPPEPERAGPPKVGQHCETCGRGIDACLCGERCTRPARADRSTPTDTWAEVRAAMKARTES